MAWDVIIYKIYKIWFCIVFFILYFNNNINLNIVTALPLIRNYKSLDQSYLTKAIKDIASLSSDSTDKGKTNINIYIYIYTYLLILAIYFEIL